MFQCLLIEGENVGPEARRNAESFVITDTQFDSFLERHKCVKQLVPESNTAMRDSYLILDEYVCVICILMWVFCQCEDTSMLRYLSMVSVVMFAFSVTSQN